MEEEVNEIRERELEWKKLADLFAEYKEKMTEEVEGLRKIIREYKSSKMDMQEVLVKVRLRFLKNYFWSRPAPAFARHEFTILICHNILLDILSWFNHF